MSQIFPRKAEKLQTWKLYVKSDLQATVTHLRTGEQSVGAAFFIHKKSRKKYNFINKEAGHHTTSEGFYGKAIPLFFGTSLRL